MKLKCFEKCYGFTVNNYYDVIKYEYDNYYIVLDDDNKEHYLSITFAIDRFMEV